MKHDGKRDNYKIFLAVNYTATAGTGRLSETPQKIRTASQGETKIRAAISAASLGSSCLNLAPFLEMGTCHLQMNLK